MSVNTIASYKQLEQQSKVKNLILRWFLYFILILFASYFIFRLQIQKFFQNTNYGVWANMQNYGLRENGLLQ